MKKIFSITLLAFSFLMVNSIALAQCGDKKSKTANADCKSETAKIAVVKFHADFCGACKNLEPKISELKGKFDESVVFVKFDFTNDNVKAKTRTFASEQGLNSVLESNSGTGYLVVYDLKTKQVLAKLDNTLSATDMEKTIKNYL
jgi:thiol-disulfide isomerase/thioredoxin